MAYRVTVVKAWTKPTLAERVSKALDPVDASDIVAVDYGVDFNFAWPWRRNYAYVTLR